MHRDARRNLEAHIAGERARDLDALMAPLSAHPRYVVPGWVLEGRDAVRDDVRARPALAHARTVRRVPPGARRSARRALGRGPHRDRIHGGLSAARRHGRRRPLRRRRSRPQREHLLRQARTRRALPDPRPTTACRERRGSEDGSAAGERTWQSCTARWPSSRAPRRGSAKASRDGSCARAPASSSTAGRARKARSVVAALRELGGEAIFLQADLCDRSAAMRLVDDAAAHFGRLDILVNNAQIVPPLDEATSPRTDDHLQWRSPPGCTHRSGHRRPPCPT